MHKSRPSIRAFMSRITNRGEAKHTQMVTGDRKGAHTDGMTQHDKYAALETPESNSESSCALSDLRVFRPQKLMLAVSADEPGRLYECIADLTNALKNLEEHNRQFISTNPGFITIKNCFDTALHEADCHPEITQGCRVLSKGILTTLRILEAEKNTEKDKLITKVGNFLKKLYPVARISLSLASTIAGVHPDSYFLNQRVSRFPF